MTENEPNLREPFRYANYLEVQFTIDEFTLEIGQRFDDEEPQIHTGIVTTPLYARAFLETLERSVREHEPIYGMKPPAAKGSEPSE